MQQAIYNTISSVRIQTSTTAAKTSQVRVRKRRTCCGG